MTCMKHKKIIRGNFIGELAHSPEQPLDKLSTLEYISWPYLFCCTRGSAAPPLSLSLSLSFPPCFSLSLSLSCEASPLSTSDKKMRISIGEIHTVCEPAFGHGGVRLLSHTASSPSSFFFGLLGGGVSPCFSPLLSAGAGVWCVVRCVWGLRGLAWPSLFCCTLSLFPLSLSPLSPLLSAGAGVWCVVRCVWGGGLVRVPR